MKINWKEVAASEGYKTLKAAYVEQVSSKKIKGSWIKKPEYYARFQKVIYRAQHIAHVTGIPVTTILARWEQERIFVKRYNFDNYYRNYLPSRIKVDSVSEVKMGLRGITKYYREQWNHCPKQRKYRKQRVGEAIRDTLPKRDPPRSRHKRRWNAKDRRIREYRRKRDLKQSL